MKEQIVGKCQAQVSIVSFGGNIFSVTISRKGEVRKLTDCNWRDVERVLSEIQYKQVGHGSNAAAQTLGQTAGALSQAAGTPGLAAAFQSVTTGSSNTQLLEQELRRDCVRMAIQAGSPPGQIVECAETILKWLKAHYH